MSFTKPSLIILLSLLSENYNNKNVSSAVFLAMDCTMYHMAHANTELKSRERLEKGKVKMKGENEDFIILLVKGRNSPGE